MFLLQYKCCIETKFSRCSSQEMVIVWLQFNSENVAHVNLLQYQLTRKGKSLNFCHCVTPIKPRSHMPSGAFSYVRNSLHSCIYLSLSPILQDRDRKFVYRFGARARCRKSLFVGSLEISLKKSSHRKNAENFCHKNSMARGCADTRGGGYSFTLAT